MRPTPIGCFLDLPEPGRAMEVVARALRPGGVAVSYVPTAMQLKETVEALQYTGNFAEIESFETLMRHWQVKGLSVRPVHRMVAHSAFIIVARRLAPSVLAAPAAPSSLGTADDSAEIGDMGEAQLDGAPESAIGNDLDDPAERESDRDDQG